MSHTYHHSENSVKIWGGTPEDYLAIHDWLDDTKETFADFRHRALRHHSQGIFEAERLFGHVIVNSDGKKCQCGTSESSTSKKTAADLFRVFRTGFATSNVRRGCREATRSKIRSRSFIKQRDSRISLLFYGLFVRAGLATLAIFLIA